MLRLLFVAASAVAAGAAPVILGFLGRQDATAGAYDELLEGIQKTGQQKKLEILYPSGEFQSFEDMESEMQRLKAQHPGAAVVYMGHGMGDQGGATLAQHYAANASRGGGAAALVLLAGFLERSWRPDVARCAETWRIQPTVKCPKGLCPGGYLKDGVHNCSGPAVPAPEYPLPSLSIGGELDGVVRISRMAEAWYTQQALPQHQVKLVLGMNHGDLLTSLPSAVAQRDLASECGAAKARSQVADLIVDFLLSLGREASSSPSSGNTRNVTPEEEIFEPFVEVFAKQEGSWWWTSNSDESGSSLWAAEAQRRLVQPLPKNCGATWRARNDFRMLSDEELIPPYYRTKHRPNITGSTASTDVLDSLTVTQLRYVEISVLQAAAGLNGWQVIKEEKAGVLADSHLALKDDGSDFTSAIEIATKLASRELAFKVCGEESGPAVDDGDRCKAINQAAYDLALNLSSSSARARFQQRGRRLVMAPDRKPMPPAGPWWIWNYLSYADKGEEVEVSSWYAFYPLSGPAYGAGNHYCKLLSPARALEWIYIDGLRGKGNQSSVVMI